MAAYPRISACLTILWVMARARRRFRRDSRALGVARRKAAKIGRCRLEKADGSRKKTNLGH
jgi:hypothetical protein